jgi:chemotaxis protein histidine kinase CheA
MRDASLLELFSLEAEAQTQVLSAGLLALERNPTQADQLEACMRAAHSLKGAARIVGVDAGRQRRACDGRLPGRVPRKGRLHLQAPNTSTRCCMGTDHADAHRDAGREQRGASATWTAYVALMNDLIKPGARPAAAAPNLAPSMEDRASGQRSIAGGVGAVRRSVRLRPVRRSTGQPLPAELLLPVPHAPRSLSATAEMNRQGQNPEVVLNGAWPRVASGCTAGHGRAL